MYKYISITKKYSQFLNFNQKYCITSLKIIIF